MTIPQPIPIAQATRPLGPLNFTLLSSGITTAPSQEPIVTVYQTQYINTYHLCILVYVPEGAFPVMDEDFSSIVNENTQAGNIPTRQLMIRYNDPHTSTYTLWIMEVDYVVDGTEAKAIRVYFEVGDPIASRGTITTVCNT
ncbi:MAG TPA: hypothetical protein VF008_32420 [Niastella sp.]